MLLETSWRALLMVPARLISLNVALLSGSMELSVWWSQGGELLFSIFSQTHFYLLAFMFLNFTTVPFTMQAYGRVFESPILAFLITQCIMRLFFSHIFAVACHLSIVNRSKNVKLYGNMVQQKFGICVGMYQMSFMTAWPNEKKIARRLSIASHYRVRPWL